MQQPFAAKLQAIRSPEHGSEQWIEQNEMVVVFDWSHLGECFLLGRADGTLEVRRVDDVKLNYKVAVIPSGIIASGMPGGRVS